MEFGSILSPGAQGRGIALGAAPATEERENLSRTVGGSSSNKDPEVWEEFFDINNVAGQASTEMLVIPTRKPNGGNLSPFPQELILTVFTYADSITCASFRASCQKANVVYLVFAWRYLQSQLFHPTPTRFPFLTFRELTEQHNDNQRDIMYRLREQVALDEEDRMDRAYFARDERQVTRGGTAIVTVDSSGVGLSSSSKRGGEEEMIENPPHKGNAVVGGSNPLEGGAFSRDEGPSSVGDDDGDDAVEFSHSPSDENRRSQEEKTEELPATLVSSAEISIRKIAAPSAATPRPAGNRLRDITLTESMLNRNINHNFKEGRFNFTTVEKQSHAEPVVLPNGMVCFSRWQLLAVFVRVPEAMPPTGSIDPDGKKVNFSYPQKPSHFNKNRWAKAGYLPAHTDTITAMKYHRNSNTLMTSAFDGVIKRWSIRDDFAPEEEKEQAECLGLLATYHFEDPNAAALPSLFTFDIMDLTPPWLMKGDDAYHHYPSLIAAGSESGSVIIQLVDIRGNQQLGVFASFDNRARDVRFLNKHVFTEDFDKNGVQTGSVHIVACTMTNTYFIGLNIKRTRTDVLRELGEIRSDMTEEELARAVGPRYGYTYEAVGEPTLLTPQVPFADTPSSIDIPALFWPLPSEVPQYRIPQSRQTKTSFDNVPWLPKVEDCGILLERDADRFVSLYRGNPYLTNPVVIFTFSESSCALASLNINNPPLDGQTPTNSTAVPYRWDALSADTLKATCTKWSPNYAFLAVGTQAPQGGGAVKLLVARPRAPPFTTISHSGPGILGAGRVQAVLSAEALLPQAANASGEVGTGGVLGVATHHPPADGRTHASVSSVGGTGRLSPSRDSGDGLAPTLADDNNNEGRAPEEQSDQDADDGTIGSLSGVSLLRSLAPSLGVRADQDGFISEVLNARRAIEQLSGQLGGLHRDEDPSGFSCLKLRPIHPVPVSNITVTDTHVISIDNHSTTHVYCLKTLTLAWYVTQHEGIPRPPVKREKFSEQIIALDAASHMFSTRYVIVQNGTMIISPLVVTHHTLIGDFTPLFRDPDAQTKCREAEQAEINRRTAPSTPPPHMMSLADFQPLEAKVLSKKEKAEIATTAKKKYIDEYAENNGIVSTVDQRIPSKDLRMSSVGPRRVRAQKSLFSFHLAYVVFPPFAFFVITLVILFLALAIEEHLKTPFLVTVLFGEVLGVMPYFLGDVYCYEPMVVHMSGLSFGCRVVADICYLVLFPMIYALKMDGFYPFTHVSWVIWSIPLHLALLLALVAITMEITYEVKHNIVLWRPSATSQRIFRMINDILLVTLASVFVVLMGMYFDGPVPDGANPAIASFANPDLKIFSHVFLPAWVILLYGSLFLHKLINFNPDPLRLCRSWITFICTMTLLLCLYLIFLWLPLLGFCFKFDNYYEHSHWVAPSSPLSTAVVSPGICTDNTSLPMTGSSSSSSDVSSSSSSTVFGSLINVSAALLVNATTTSSTCSPVAPGVITGVESYLRPFPTSSETAAKIPLAVVFSPLMFFVVIMCAMTIANAGVHYKQLMRHAHTLPEVNPPPQTGGQNNDNGAARTNVAQAAARPPAQQPQPQVDEVV